MAGVAGEKSSLLARRFHINNDGWPGLQDREAFCRADVRRDARCDEMTWQSKLDRLIRKGICPGQAAILSPREYETALSPLLPKAMMHGIL